jgi:hypothetical protein
MPRGRSLAPALFRDEFFLPRDGRVVLGARWGAWTPSTRRGAGRALPQARKQVALLIALFLAPHRILRLLVYGRRGLALTRIPILRLDLALLWTPILLRWAFPVGAGRCGGSP